MKCINRCVTPDRQFQLDIQATRYCRSVTYPRIPPPPPPPTHTHTHNTDTLPSAPTATKNANDLCNIDIWPIDLEMLRDTSPPLTGCICAAYQWLEQAHCCERLQNCSLMGTFGWLRDFRFLIQFYTLLLMPLSRPITSLELVNSALCIARFHRGWQHPHQLRYLHFMWLIKIYPPNRSLVGLFLGFHD